MVGLDNLENIKKLEHNLENNRDSKNSQCEIFYHGSYYNIPDDEMLIPKKNFITVENGDSIFNNDARVYLTKDVRYALWRCGNFDIYRKAEGMGIIKDAWKYGFKEDYNGKDREFTVVELNDGAFEDIFQRGYGRLNGFIGETEKSLFYGPEEKEYFYQDEKVVGFKNKNNRYIYMVCYNPKDNNGMIINSVNQNGQPLEYYSNDYIRWDYKVPISQLGETVFWMIRNYWNEYDVKNNKIVPDAKIDMNYKIRMISYHSLEWWKYWENKDYDGYMARRKSRAVALRE